MKVRDGIPEQDERYIFFRQAGDRRWTVGTVTSDDRKSVTVQYDDGDCLKSVELKGNDEWTPCVPPGEADHG